MAIGITNEFLSEGLAAARPAIPVLANYPSNIPANTIAFYYATDTNELSLYADGAWVENILAGGGGGAAWGGITGTLSAQTDLQTALNAKLDDSQATAFGLSLLDDVDAAAGRATLALGTLATQSGTFSGTSSGTNTGDQTTVTGNAGSATVLQTSRDFSIAGSGITAAAVAFTGASNVVLAASVDAGHITLARMADIATGSLIYRKTAGTGVPEVQTLATLKTDLGLTGTNSGDQTSIVGITGSLAEFNAALTGADFTTGGGTSSGTNTGDQTSIVGITGTLAQFDTACTDANFLSVAAAAAAYQPLAAVLTGTTASFTTAQETKLAGVATGATANSSDATLLARANHTGTQTAATVSDFDSASRAQTEAELIAGANITITPAGSGATRTLTLAASGGGGGGALTFSTAEIDIGAKARDSGSFTISGAGMTIGKPVLVQQAVGPYTGKGTLADEAEMDQLLATASVTSATVITGYWRSTGPMAGNVKLNYVIGA